MHNRFITQHFDWAGSGSKKLRLANWSLEHLGFGTRLRAPGSTGTTTSLEMRINLFHLVDQVLAYDVPGAFVALGTSTGQTAALIGRVLQNAGREHELHVFDTFASLCDDRDTRKTLAKNFASMGLTQPVVHAGPFEKTIPLGLPEKLAFVHIDCWGEGESEGDPEAHSRPIIGLLEQVYPRLSKGGICSITHYYDRDLNAEAASVNATVKAGCDGFLSGKPERVSVLYGAECGHGYFRKL